MKFSKKVKKEDEKKDEEPMNKKTYTLEDKPYLYIYSMYNNQVYDDTMTWGDLFRLFKYYRKFAKWDAEDGNRKLRVYPNRLSKN